VLYWDRIETIVPESIQQPYQRRTTRALEDSGILFPHRVNPNSEEVRGLELDVATYLNTKEGKHSFLKPWSGPFGQSMARKNMMEEELKERFSKEYEEFYIHVEKLPMMLHDQLKRRTNEDGFVWACKGFMSFYMTLLANRICDKGEMALLTDKVAVNDFSNKIFTDKISHKQRPERTDHLLKGIMYEIMMENIKIDPSTPIEKIIRYKNSRATELNRFRREMNRLCAINIEGMNLDDLEHELLRIYEHQVVPSINNVKATLKDEKIDWLMDIASNYLLCGIIPTAMTLYNPNAFTISSLAVSFGLSLTLSTVKYYRHNRIIEKRSPYTYLLKMNKMFTNGGKRL